MKHYLLSLAVLLAGCGGGGTPAPQAGPTAAPLDPHSPLLLCTDNNTVPGCIQPVPCAGVTGLLCFPDGTPA